MKNALKPCATTLLREEVIPLYYDRDSAQCTDRMATDYVLKAYIPAADGTSSEMRS